MWLDEGEIQVLFGGFRTVMEVSLDEVEHSGSFVGSMMVVSY